MATEPDWPTCRAKDCAAAAAVDTYLCFAHLGTGLDKVLERIGPGAHIDARGTEISGKLLSRLLDAVSGKDRRPTFGVARFEHARFTDVVTFKNVVFGDSHFEHAQFAETVSFDETIFAGRACFDETRFGGVVLCQGAAFLDGVSFINAKFAKRAWLGSMRTTVLRLDRARFEGPAEVDVVADHLSCRLTRFEEGVNLQLNRADVVAEQTTFGAPTSMTGEVKPAEVTWKPPRLLSLRGTDVSNLELADIDLASCAFAGAHRLDQLRLAGRCPFDEPPASWRWTRRQTLSEEGQWRGWKHPGKVGPERIATLYRSLRKALEDSKNEAGAGDFYYGEMEMRRHSTETRRTERWILWFYWLLSGYGQRAGRALCALVVLIATVATLLAVWGQAPAEAARIAVGAVVLRDPGTKLTEAGQWTVMAARFLGPVLLALAVLAVRARVKR